MFIERWKYLQGYVRVRLSGYAPERFFNLCGSRGILIWNLEYVDGQYEFCISVKGLKGLKPILRKTRTRFAIKERAGLPFVFVRCRKRKLFFAGAAACCCLVYVMSLFVWKIEVNGNLHETDSAILEFLEKENVYHGLLKSRIDCEKVEEALRAEYGDVIWASAKLEGTALIIDVQESLAAGRQAPGEAAGDGAPSDLVAEKDAVIYSILTRQGTPQVEKGMRVQAGSLLVEGRNPVLDDNGEIASYQYCASDADILGVTEYQYEDKFPLRHKEKAFTGEESVSYGLRVFGRLARLPYFGGRFKEYDAVTDERAAKIGETFYLPLSLVRQTRREYETVEKTYSKTEAETLAKERLDGFCEDLEQKGVQIIENNVMIVTDGKNCTASGSLRAIEPIGARRATAATELPQEGQTEDEPDGNGH